MWLISGQSVYIDETKHHIMERLVYFVLVQWRLSTLVVTLVYPNLENCLKWLSTFKTSHTHSAKIQTSIAHSAKAQWENGLLVNDDLQLMTCKVGIVVKTKCKIMPDKEQ